MKQYPGKAISILSVVAAAGVLLPLNAQGMQELPPVPLSDVQSPSQPGPENKLAPVSDPILPPVPGPLNHADADGTEGAEPMLRGPVHEAFAEQFNQNPVQGHIIPQEPPEPIEELPPDVRPDGRQVEWISGYWAWDDDDQDFFWVSGIWREVPQGFRWLPGYWSKAETGYQWISGTWIPEQTEEIQYVEAAPPESLELGPVGLAPSQEHIWIPGCWNWNDLRYAWRPGYWSMGYTNWIWIPARHVWTPRGYLNCNGYWDYPLNRRGLLFAPYRFRRSTHWNRPRGFTPQIVIAINQLHWNLWVRPRSSHYYFGDYYGPRYANTGFQPWHQFHQQRRQFDPLYSHFSRSAGVGNVSFYDQVNGRFNLLTSHVDRRPARTFIHHEGREPSRLNNIADRSPVLGSTIQQHIKEAGNTRFVKLQEDQRIRLQSDSKSVRQLVDQRREVENRGRLEVTRPGKQTNESVGRILNADRHDTELRDKPSGPETRNGKKRSDLAESVTRPPFKENERSDRLRLPPVVPHGKDNTEQPTPGSSSNVKASEPGTPGSPVTRGERPRGVDSILNRQRNSADSNTAGSLKGNLSNNTRERATRSVDPPGHSRGTNDPPPRIEREARQSAANRSDAAAVHRKIDTGNRPQNETRSAPAARSAAEKTRSAPTPRSALEKTRSAPMSTPAAEKTRTAPTPRPAAEKTRPAPTPRPAAEKTRSAPTPRPAVEKTRPAPTPRPAAEKTRSAPTPKPAAEKTRRTESAPAARPPRAQTNAGAGNGERRKKK